MANKKVSNTKKSSKSASKSPTKPSWFRKTIDISTRKGQFIAFIFIFAVIGGGYAVYSTYAAAQSFDFYPVNISAYNAQYGTVADINNMKIISDDTGNKSPVNVAQMPAGAIYSFQIRANQNIEKKAGFDVFNYQWRGGSYQICANVRTTSGTGQLRIQYRQESILSFQNNYDRVVGSTYGNICVDFKDAVEGDRLRFGNLSNTPINVDRIIITKK